MLNYRFKPSEAEVDDNFLLVVHNFLVYLSRMQKYMESLADEGDMSKVS